MKLRFIILGAMAMLCLCLVAAAEEYATYDCEYFSVEYPSDWDVEKSVNIAYEGWTYQFGSEISVIAGYLFGQNYNVLLWMVPATFLNEGSILDERKRHFIETLNFKNGEKPGYSPSVTNRTYECMFFSVEYPEEWGYMNSETDTIFDTLTYSISKSNDAHVSIIISEDNIFGFKVGTSRRGYIASDPVGNIIDTLKFKF